MKFNFIIPGVPVKPSGGFRVAFELANRLCLLRNEVLLTFVLNRPSFSFSVKWLKKKLKYRKKKQAINAKEHVKWFNFDNDVKFDYIDDLEVNEVQGADYIVATNWRSAEVLLKRKKCPLIHLVQHYEFWSDKIDRINSVCSSKELIHICVSRWIKEKVDKLGVESFNIPIGIESKLFQLKSPIEKRSCNSVCFMFHTAKWKGSHVVIEVLKDLGRQKKDLIVNAFGVYDFANEGVSNYLKNPPQSAIADMYNQSAIFISSSYSEGLGLPPMEAMACGCAVITTNSGGVMDFCVPNENCLMIQPESPKEMADALLKLVNDNDLRVRLAHKGHEHITRNFTWDKTIHSFLEILKSK
ncbi:MAG: glycosyltransferase family 4 protein [Planctomycetes bacterium]|nr:glycosyltransferase family 4 protein [Planctomycetota bacterium]